MRPSLKTGGGPSSPGYAHRTGMSVPAGFGEGGMPVGLQLIGNYFSEARLLNAAHRLQQARNAQGGVGAQFQRVAEIVVQPAQHHLHRGQPGEGFQEQLVAAHGEVAAFHQRDAQIARQISVLKIGFVIRARGEQHHARRALARGGRAELRQGGQQLPVAAGQMLHAQLAKRLGKQPRDNQPVFQRIPKP